MRPKDEGSLVDNGISYAAVARGCGPILVPQCRSGGEVTAKAANGCWGLHRFPAREDRGAAGPHLARMSVPWPERSAWQTISLGEPGLLHLPDRKRRAAEAAKKAPACGKNSMY